MSPSDPLSRRACLLLLLAAGLLRGGVLWGLQSQLHADPDAYRLFATTLIETGVYAPGRMENLPPAPSAYRPPLYPLLLTLAVISPLGFVPTVALFHWLLGLATIAGVLYLARRHLPAQAAALAVLLVSCDPLLLFQSALVMTETLAAALAVAALVALDRLSREPRLSRAALAGGLLGLGVLCRPTFALFLVAAMLGLLWLLPRGAKFKTALALVATGAVVVLPWVVRNQRVFGQPIWATTHGGYTLHLANNPAYYEFLERGAWGEVWQAPEGLEPGDFLNAKLPLPPAEIAQSPPNSPVRELWRDRAHYEQARETIRDQPGVFLRASVDRLGQFWQMRPHQTQPDEPAGQRLARYAIGLWYLLEFALACGGIYLLGKRLGQSPWVWMGLLSLSLMLPHAVYWTNLRMRAPLMPAVALLAAVGSTPLWARWRRHKFLSPNKLNAATGVGTCLDPGGDSS